MPRQRLGILSATDNQLDTAGNKPTRTTSLANHNRLAKEQQGLTESVGSGEDVIELATDT